MQANPRPKHTVYWLCMVDRVANHSTCVRCSDLVPGDKDALSLGQLLLGSDKTRERPSLLRVITIVPCNSCFVWPFASDNDDIVSTKWASILLKHLFNPRTTILNVL